MIAHRPTPERRPLNERVVRDATKHGPIEGAHRHSAASGTKNGAVSQTADCDRTVIRRRQNLEEHQGLRRRIEESFGRAKLPIAYALARFGVAWCCSPASLSKRAPSTTRPSLLFRIIHLRAGQKRVFPNCDTPPNLLRSLTATHCGRSARSGRHNSRRADRLPTGSVYSLAKSSRRFHRRRASTRAESAAGCCRRQKEAREARTGGVSPEEHAPRHHSQHAARRAPRTKTVLPADVRERLRANIAPGVGTPVKGGPNSARRPW